MPYVKEALELGLNPSLPDALDRNLPILFTALRNGRFEIARLLVKYGANPNQRTQDRSEPLIGVYLNWVCLGFCEGDLNEHVAMVELLLEHGASRAVGREMLSGFDSDSIHLNLPVLRMMQLVGMERKVALPNNYAFVMNPETGQFEVKDLDEDDDGI